MRVTTSCRAIAIALLTLLAITPGCGRAREGGSPPKDPALDRKLERLLSLIVDVERRGAGDDDSAAVEASRMIAELGGPDSTAKVLAERLIRNSDRWIPVLDSLGRIPAAGPDAAAPATAPAQSSPPRS